MKGCSVCGSPENPEYHYPGLPCIKYLKSRLRDARNEALEEAAKIAENSCLSPPDGGSPTDQEIESAEYAARLIRAAKKVEQ